MQAFPETRIMHLSRLRHRPIAPDVRSQQVQTRRASRYRHKHEPHTTGGPASVAARHRSSGLWLIYLALGIIMAMGLLWLGQMLIHFGQTVADDLRYGRPRTTNVDHFVGHEANHVPSHFTALNLGGQIYVIEIPGGNPSSSRLLVGPRLIGGGADLAPVTLSFVGDSQHPDLLIEAGGIQTRFRNTGSTYEPGA